MKQLLCVLLIAVAPVSAAANGFGLGTSAAYSTGRYGGTEATRLATASLTGTASLRGWELSAALPYVVVEAGGEEISVGGVLIRPEGRERISGFGDIFLTAARSVLPQLPVDVTLQAQLKAPTGSSNLSTGMVDGGVDVELSKQVGSFAPFVSGGYRFYGDAADLDLENGWVASAGTSITRGRLTLIGSYDWSQSPVGLPGAHELFAVASGPLVPSWTWSLYGSKGLSDGAVDLMFGFALSRTFAPPQ